jgi:plasmid stabilization system protein ParE
VSLPVRTTPEAEAQIREIENWWRKNRLAAPDLFINELSESFELLSWAPQIGHLYRPSPVRGVRRLLLGGTRYHVYYAVVRKEVSVLAVWHAQRGVGPPLRTSLTG